MKFSDRQAHTGYRKKLAPLEELRQVFADAGEPFPEIRVFTDPSPAPGPHVSAHSAFEGSYHPTELVASLGPGKGVPAAAVVASS